MTTEHSATTRGAAWRSPSSLTTQLMVILDGTIVNVALPTIRDRPRLHRQRAGLGRQRLLRRRSRCCSSRPGGSATWSAAAGSSSPGWSLFTAASALLRARPGPGARWSPRGSAQGVGGALTSAVVLGMIARLLRRRRAAPDRGPSPWLAFVGSAGASIGVVAGGLLTDLASWRWVFLVNVPIGVAGPRSPHWPSSSRRRARPACARSAGRPRPRAAARCSPRRLPRSPTWCCSR